MNHIPRFVGILRSGIRPGIVTCASVHRISACVRENVNGNTRFFVVRSPAYSVVFVYQFVLYIAEIHVFQSQDLDLT